MALDNEKRNKMEKQPEVTTTNQYIEAIKKLASDRDKLYLFRGEPKRFQHTLPTLYRNEALLYAPTYYYRMLLSEIGKSNYATNTDLSSSMAELQHYGAKSNLLDVTTNALVALHFALGKDEYKDERGGVKVYAVKKEKIKFDTGHTIALKLATNFMDLKEIWKFYRACEKIRRIYHDVDAIHLDIEMLNHVKKKGDCDVESIDTILNFMEKLTQIAKTRERYCQPLRVYEDLRKTHFFYGSKNTERIRRQSGAFIAPPILDRGEDQTLAKALQRSLEKEEIFINQLYRNNVDNFKPEKEVSKLNQKFLKLFENKALLNIEDMEKIRDMYYKAYLEDMLSRIDQQIVSELDCTEIFINKEKLGALKRDLKMLGIDSGTVFPDVENISDSIIPTSSTQTAHDDLRAICERVHLSEEKNFEGDIK